MPTVLKMCPKPIIDILKIDIEGAEATLFNMDAKRWLKFVRNFCVEIHSAEAESKVLKALQDFDFQYIQCGEYNVYLDLRLKENPAAHTVH